MSKTNYEIDLGNGQLIKVSAGGGNRSVQSNLERLTCPSCALENCVHSCDGSQGSLDEADDDVASRLKYNGGLDALESLVLALACEGIDVGQQSVTVAVLTALDALSNQVP